MLVKCTAKIFFLTWEKSDDELKGVWAVADALRALRRTQYLH